MVDEAFTRLFHRYAPLIYARCHRILGRDDLADDATQETFLRVYRHLAGAPGEEEARTWIIRIATNYALNLREYEARRREVLLPGPVARGDLERALADREFARHLVLAAPPKLRATAWLHLVEGFEQEEVARLLDLSRRTVVSRLQDFKDYARRFAARSEP